MNLIDAIQEDSVSKVIRYHIRYERPRGSFDPVFVSPEYRSITIEEVSNLIPGKWIEACGNKLARNNDLRALRHPQKDLIVIEVNHLRRHRVGDRISYYKTYEHHRLIKGNDQVNRSKFRFGNEELVWRKTLETDLIYEVTRQKSAH